MQGLLECEKCSCQGVFTDFTKTKWRENLHCEEKNPWYKKNNITWSWSI